MKSSPMMLRLAIKIIAEQALMTTCLDLTCESCGHPELGAVMSRPVYSPSDPDSGQPQLVPPDQPRVVICRKCGNASVLAPTS